MTCRHNKSWFVAGGYIEWCWVCGAIREMVHFGTMGVTPSSYWAKPTAGEYNPYGKTWGKKYKKKDFKS